MSKLDEILYKRLERIREELDAYIAEKIDEPLIAAPIMQAPTVHHSVAGSFLNKLRLEDEEDESDYDDECDYAEEQTVHSATVPQPRPSVSEKALHIPQFLHAGKPKSDLDKVLEKKAETFSSMLLRLIDEKGLKDSEVYKKANIDRRLFSKIRGDEDYVPSKKTAISFCLALQLEMDEAKKLLEVAGYALSEASRFDLIIMYLIENSEYNIHFANIVLNDYGEGSLSK